MKWEYLYVALCVVFLSVVVGLLVPEGKLKKMVNLVLRLVCICVLINPVVNLFGLEATDISGEPNYEYVCEVYSKSQGKELKKIIEAEFGEECQCTVSVEYADEKLIESGVTIVGDFSDFKTVEKIVEYLKGLGYIDITVNGEAY